MTQAKATLYLLIVITLIGGFLRLFRLSQTLQFLGDQGRDVLIVRKVLLERDLVFIGPVTSVGNMYLGPLYYYFMLPFLALSYPSPMGPVYAVALLGTLTIPLLYKLGKELVGKEPAFFASILLAFGWIFIYQSRFSWNPNPAPIVSLIMMWAAYKAWVKDVRYWVLVGLCFSVLIQLHYLTLLTLPTAGIIWLFNLYEIMKQKRHDLKPFFISTVLAIFIFLVSLTPLVLYDLKHNFTNVKAFYEIIFGKEDQVRTAKDSFKIFMEIFGRSHQILFEISTNNLRWLNNIMILVVSVVLLLLFKEKNSPYLKGRIIVFTWLIVGILGTALYKSSVFEHYIAYLFPVTCLILGMVLSKLKESPWTSWASAVFFIWFFVTNFSKYDYKSVGWPIQEMEKYTKEVSKLIEPGEPYTLVGINSYNDIYAMNVRYLLTVQGKKPLETEDANSAKKLVIINESNEPVRKVLDSPIYEVVIFPEKSNVETHYPEYGPQVLILRR